MLVGPRFGLLLREGLVGPTLSAEVGAVALAEPEPVPEVAELNELNPIGLDEADENRLPEPTCKGLQTEPGVPLKLSFPSKDLSLESK